MDSKIVLTNESSDSACKPCSVSTEKEVLSAIRAGVVVLVGIEESDNNEDIAWLANKIVQLRIFNDSNGVMNLSVRELEVT